MEASIRLDELRRFETLLFQVVTDLIHVPADRLDQAIRRSVGALVTAVSGDRGAFDVEAAPDCRHALPCVRFRLAG
jgi:hypothetical protein